MSPSVESRLWRRYQETGEYTRRHGQGRSQMTTPRQDRSLVLLSRHNRMSTARALKSYFHSTIRVDLPDQTAMNLLHNNCMRARRLARGHIITAQNRKQMFVYIWDILMILISNKQSCSFDRAH